MHFVILGLSITSSWENSHAGVFRGLVRGLSLRGHEVLFLERDNPWHTENRDLPPLEYGRTAFYFSVNDLQTRFRETIAGADCVILGSALPDGLEIGRWIHRAATGTTVFYDLDTPATAAAVEWERCPYLDRPLMRAFSLYLSSTGGPLLERLEQAFHVRRARPLFFAADPFTHFPEPGEKRFDLGHFNPFREDGLPALERFLLAPARLWPEGRFLVAGPHYPPALAWPPNVERTIHLPLEKHRGFYASQRFALHLTPLERQRSGFSPGVRLFEAAACGVAILTDAWEGLELFFEPGREVLVVRSTAEALALLRELPEAEVRSLGELARKRVLAEHTAAHRAVELELHIAETRVPGLAF